MRVSCRDLLPLDLADVVGLKMKFEERPHGMLGLVLLTTHANCAVRTSETAPRRAKDALARPVETEVTRPPPTLPALAPKLYTVLATDDAPFAPPSTGPPSRSHA